MQRWSAATAQARSRLLPSPLLTLIAWVAMMDPTQIVGLRTISISQLGTIGIVPALKEVIREPAPEILTGR